MQNHLLGSVYALLAAVVWAFAVVLFKKGGEKIQPMALNLFKNSVAIILLAATLLVTQDGFHTLKEFSSRDLWILALSGILGITVADTLFFYSLNILGVGFSSIMDCMYSPFVIFFSVLLLSESMTPLQYVGGGFIVGAVLITSRHQPPQGRTRFMLLLGIFLAMLSKAFMAYGIIIAKRILEGPHLMWATTIRVVPATISLALLMLILPRQKTHFSVFLPSRTWKVTIPASVLGAYLALVFWTAGFKYTDASIAAILNQTTTVFAIILATVILKEAFTQRKLVAVTLAVTGIILVTLGKT